MKQIFKSALIAASIIAAAAAGASAQNRSAYFSDNYTYGFILNPAFGGEKGFVSFPVLGNFNMATHGNVGIDNFIFPDHGKTMTFLHPDVSASKFLGGLKDNNRLGFGGKLGILSVGFKAFKGYNTVSINANYDMSFRMPKSIFALLKQGVENRDYDITNFDAHAVAYGEIAFNHSHQITKQLRVGAAVKFLIGAGNVDINMQKAHLTLGEDNWKVLTNARIQANVAGLKYKTSWSKETNRDYVDGMDFDSPGIGGYGVAFDLGAVYQLNSDWKFSLAFNDLGFINWKNNMVASTNGDREFNLDKYVFDPDDMDATFDDMKDEIATLYQLDDMGDTGSRTRGIAATMNVGAEYTFPLYRNLTFGLLNTTRIAGEFSWTDFRLSANVRPVKCLSAAVNYGIGTFGSSFGWVLNLYTTGFNLYLGMDHTLGKLAKQFVPLNPNSQFSLGINFPF